MKLTVLSDAEIERENNQDDKIAVIERIENLQNKKLCIVEEKGNRLAEKLATKWFIEGKKSTKYFYRILNRSMPDKLSVLVTHDGREITKEEDINQAMV